MSCKAKKDSFMISLPNESKTPKDSSMISLNIRERRMKENCKCQTDTGGSVCRCRQKQGETKFMDHFNDIFNRS
jgi:hypothetical protein|tara:strand:+ start:1894 stop:2115 length:222 start_codon:yes stop_codon:yes gene_type:complete